MSAVQPNTPLNNSRIPESASTPQPMQPVHSDDSHAEFWVKAAKIVFLRERALDINNFNLETTTSYNVKTDRGLIDLATRVVNELNPKTASSSEKEKEQIVAVNKIFHEQITKRIQARSGFCSKVARYFSVRRRDEFTQLAQIKGNLTTYLEGRQWEPTSPGGSSDAAFLTFFSEFEHHLASKFHVMNEDKLKQLQVVSKYIWQGVTRGTISLPKVPAAENLPDTPEAFSEEATAYRKYARCMTEYFVGTHILFSNHEYEYDNGIQSPYCPMDREMHETLTTNRNARVAGYGLRISSHYDLTDPTKPQRHFVDHNEALFSSDDFFVDQNGAVIPSLYASTIGEIRTYVEARRDRTPVAIPSIKTLTNWVLRLERLKEALGDQLNVAEKTGIQNLQNKLKDLRRSLNPNNVPFHEENLEVFNQLSQKLVTRKVFWIQEENYPDGGHLRDGWSLRNMTNKTLHRTVDYLRYTALRFMGSPRPQIASYQANSTTYQFSRGSGDTNPLVIDCDLPPAQAASGSRPYIRGT